MRFATLTEDQAWLVAELIEEELLVRINSVAAHSEMYAPEEMDIIREYAEIAETLGRQALGWRHDAPCLSPEQDAVVAAVEQRGNV